MPIRSNLIPDKAKEYYQNVSYEHQVASWLLKDGWEVYIPHVDHGARTDVLISDGEYYYRIQVKSVDKHDENTVVKPMWEKHDNIDLVIYFSKKGQWGYIAPLFHKPRKLNHHEHLRFHQNSTNFLKAFAKI